MLKIKFSVRALDKIVEIENRKWLMSMKTYTRVEQKEKTALGRDINSTLSLSFPLLPQQSFVSRVKIQKPIRGAQRVWQ